MSAPERIWVDYPAANKAFAAYDEAPRYHGDAADTEYVRADRIAALEAEVERLRAATIRPLTWYVCPEGETYRIGRCGDFAYMVTFEAGAWSYRREGSPGRVVSFVGCKLFETEEDAMRGADDDHQRRIAEALANREDTP